MCLELISPISDNYWKLIENGRKIRFTVHRAYFIAVGVECFFLNVTNLSPKKEIELTHIYFQNKDGSQIPVIQPDRPLPKRLRPVETWETWIRVVYILIEKYTTFSLKSIPLLMFNELLWKKKSNAKTYDKDGYETRNLEKVLS